MNAADVGKADIEYCRKHNIPVATIYETNFHRIRLSDPLVATMERLEATRLGKKRYAELENAICKISEICYACGQDLTVL